jgi:hypothetical protein
VFSETKTVHRSKHERQRLAPLHQSYLNAARSASQSRRVVRKALQGV